MLPRSQIWPGSCPRSNDPSVLNCCATSTFARPDLGGTGVDEANGIAVDGEGNAYVTGEATNVSFPTVNAIQATYAGGAQDVFVSKIDSEGGRLVYSTRCFAMIGRSAKPAGGACCRFQASSWPRWRGLA